MFFLDDEGVLKSLPRSWTDHGDPDAFVAMASGRSRAAVPPQPCAIKMVGRFLPAEALGAKTSAYIRVPSLTMLARRKAISSGGVKGAVCARAATQNAIERNQRMAGILTWMAGVPTRPAQAASLPHFVTFEACFGLSR